MALTFSNTNRQPEDRKYFLADVNTHFILGACSYISQGILEIGGSKPHSILVGRYSSLAWDIKFCASHNHVYENVVSTFPFHNAGVKNYISSFGHPYSETAQFFPNQSKNHRQIIIGSDVWIGRGATILGGVKIGSGAIIGTNSNITKDIPPYAIAVGNPVKIIKYRFDEETIKKFMAIKWWNWDIDKVLASAPLMNNPEKFLEKHYSPELENIPEENIRWDGARIEDYRLADRKIYSFVGDVHTSQPIWGKNIPGFERKVNMPLWKRVVSGFCQSDFENSLLIIWTGKNSTCDDLKILNNYIETFDTGAEKNIVVIPSIEEKIFSPYVLLNSTHFITTREMISLECMDRLWDTDVKIVSALDDGIFDGEPRVDWNKIFGK